MLLARAGLAYRLGSMGVLGVSRGGVIPRLLEAVGGAARTESASSSKFDSVSADLGLPTEPLKGFFLAGSSARRAS